MKILVLGGTGLLGVPLCSHLTQIGHCVRTVGTSVAADFTGDLREASFLNAVLSSTRPDAVVNLAALTDVDQCERNPAVAFQTNAGIVETLTRGILAQRIACRFVQISTDHVYGGAGPHSEQPVAPLNVYAESKLAGEQAAEGVGGVVLRINFLGASRCLGRQSLTDWLVGSLRAGIALRVFDDVYFSPLHLDTLTGEISRILATPSAPPGVYNLGARGGTSKADLAFALAKRLLLPIDLLTRARIDEAGLAAPRPHDMRMDCSKYESTFGVTLPSIAEEIDQTGADYDSLA